MHGADLMSGQLTDGEGHPLLGFILPSSIIVLLMAL